MAFDSAILVAHPVRARSRFWRLLPPLPRSERARLVLIRTQSPANTYVALCPRTRAHGERHRGRKRSTRVYYKHEFSTDWGESAAVRLVAIRSLSASLLRAPSLSSSSRHSVSPLSRSLAYLSPPPRGASSFPNARSGERSSSSPFAASPARWTDQTGFSRSFLMPRVQFDRFLLYPDPLASWWIQRRGEGRGGGGPSSITRAMASV